MATQKIHFFTGKGGVGKSTLASAFALASSQTAQMKNAKKNTSSILLTELCEEPVLFKFMPDDKKGLSIENWTTASCLNEYATNLIKSSTLTNLFLNNSVSKALINIAPGLQELALLGKATSSPRQHGPQTTYEEIFIDSFSSGHFLQMLIAPQSFTEIFTKGPMASQSKSINEWIKNPDFTKINLVTTADELSLTESLEFYERLKKNGFESRILLNKFIDFSLFDLESMPPKTKKYFLNLQDQQLLAEKELSKVCSDFMRIPFSLQPQIKNIVAEISEKIV